MLIIRRISTNRWWHKKKNWLFFAIFLFLVFVRLSKGAFYKDFYYVFFIPYNQKKTFLLDVLIRYKYRLIFD